MKKARKKEITKDLKTLSEKQKIYVIINLLERIEMMQKESSMQFELISSMIEGKKANLTGTMQ